MIMVGGQPGAGKSANLWRAHELHPTKSFVRVVGDELRRFHPEFRALSTNSPLGMPSITQAVSGPLVGLAVSYAQASRISIIVEGTFRNPEMVRTTCERFAEAGFEVHVLVVATPPPVSLLACLDRFITATLVGQGSRWTPVEAHEAALEGMAVTLPSLGQAAAVDRITVSDRSGRVLADFHGAASSARGCDASREVFKHHDGITQPVARDWILRRDQLLGQWDTHPALRRLHSSLEGKAFWERLDHYADRIWRSAKGPPEE